MSLKTEMKVALLWHTFGHGNLGVDALARGSATIIRQAAADVGLAVSFTSLGTGQNYAAADLPHDVSVGPGPRIKPLIYGRSDFLDVVRQSDIVFDIGEGDSFTDLYGPKRFAFLLGTKVAVLAASRPLVIAPQTIGPFDGALSRKLALAVLRKADAVYSRDGLSTQFLKDHDASANADEFIDVAFALPYAPQTRAGDRVRVGLNVSGLLYNGGYSGKNEFGLQLDYRKLTHQVLERLLQRDDAEVHLIAHVTGSGGADDDFSVIQALARQYPGVVVAPKFATSEVAKGYLSGMDYVVAGRMHACIGAFSAGVPVMPIAYSRKFNGLFGTLGYRHLVDGKAVGTEDAVEQVLGGLDRRAELSLDVARGLEVATERLARYRGSVARLLQEVGHG